MKPRSVISVCCHIVLAWVLCVLSATSGAAELLVWSAGAAKAPLAELVVEYQKASGTSLRVEYAPVGVLLRRLADGGQPDVLIVSAEVVAEMERRGWSVTGSALPVGNVGVGVAVKEGAPMPDISSPEALRKTLLDARSITYMDPQKGTSGKHFAAVLEQLGIAQQVKAKTTLGDVGFVVEPVARGEVELGIQQITEILPVKGAKLVGPLPDSLQKITTYSVVLGGNARDPVSATGFMTYLVSAQAATVFRQKGFSAP
jgi:molybdate transport system substrate-binding protein